MAEPASDDDRFDWVSKRNCALRPAQLALLLAIPAGASLIIAASFATMGAWWILAFAGVETVGLAIAFVVYARHAGAYERLSLTPEGLRVELHSGSATTFAHWDPRLVRIDFACARIPGFHGDGLVTVRGPGQEFRLGRFVPAPERAALAASIRGALRHSTTARAIPHSVANGQSMPSWNVVGSPDGGFEGSEKTRWRWS